jgi:hypothetical protein
MIPLTSILAVALGVIHLATGRLRFLDVIPRSRWLSLAGGASVAYVFIHLLPELSKGQQALEESGITRTVSFIEVHAYAVALLGLIVFYGLERVAIESKRRQAAATGEETPSGGVFWLHMGSFMIYNALIGYLLLHREIQTRRSLIFFFVAMALHFVVNDYGLRHHFKERYHHYGRWILAMAVLAGWGLGVWIELSKAAVAVLFAFLAGGVILNVLKEELPEERQSRFWAFFAGALVYSVFILAR